MAEVQLWPRCFLVLLWACLTYQSSESATENGMDDLQFTAKSYNLTIPENSVGRTLAMPTEKMGIFVSDTTLQVKYKIVDGDKYRIFKAESRLVGDFWFLIIRVRTGNRNPLNREYQDTYVLTIRASITSLIRPQVKMKAQTEAVISVTDTNDITPHFFPNALYNINVPEDTPLHHTLLRVSAFDPDLGINSEIYYSLTNMTLQFAIHPTRGTLTLTRPLDYRAHPLHELKVIAEDRGMKFRAADFTPKFAIVKVNVTPVNLHAPKIFVRQFPVLMMPADPNVYAIISVQDEDQGIHGEVGPLEIIDGDPYGIFRISPGSKANEYSLELEKPISKDDSYVPETFFLKLRVQDRGVPPWPTTEVVKVKITDANIAEPTFAQTDYDVEIEEVSPPGSRVFQLETNVPLGKNAVFRIEGGNANATFTVHPKSGLLTTLSQLDKETQPYYSLTVSAIDNSIRNSKRKVSPIVNIRVLDNNDNDPVFNTSSNTVVFDENKPAGSVVYTVYAADRDQDDNGYVTYSLANLNPVPFTMDPFTGEIRSTEVLDYETMRREYILKVRASDWGTPYRRQAEMTLKVQLRDVNDHRPLFEKTGCSGYVSESAPLHTEVITLSAIDFDVGSSVTYRMVSSNDDSCFRLDRIKGILKVVCNLSRQNVREATINVSATDGTHFADVMSIQLKIIKAGSNQKLADRGALIECKDVGVTERYRKQLSLARANNQDNDVTEPTPTSYAGNRYPPEFSLGLPTEVWINESLPVGSEVTTVKAKDKDRGYSGQLVYIISNGDQFCDFRIDLHTGLLTVAKPLDREVKSKYELNITAFDLGRPQYAASRSLIVHVRDINDNEPTFEKGSYNFVITENIKNGTSIVRLRATDEDEGINSALTFSLETDLDEFCIDANSGLLTVCGEVDREIADSYHIKAKVSDGSLDHPLTSTTVINVRVLDINDNPPLFSLPQYWVKVREDLPVGSVVMVMTANDPDAEDGGRVTYEINDNSPFSIDPLMGVIRLAESLDFESIQVYDLSITAKDSGEPQLKSQTTLVVEVEDLNENMHPPTFDDVVIVGEVRENQPKGTMVVQVTAVDADGPGINGQIMYSIRDGDGMGYFNIDNDGNITTNEVLDRETNHRYWLTVHAMDRGAVPLSGRVDVYIEVLDENDNVPLTVHPAYYPKVPENCPPGTIVAKLQASDLDSYSDQPLHFSITSGDPQGFFSINNETGLIVTAAPRKLDREVQAEHALEIRVQDNGTPPLSSLTRVLVNVTDINDNDPVFRRAFYLCPVLERATISDQILCQVVAFDSDSGENGLVTYSLEDVQETSGLHIDSKTGAIYSNKPLVAGDVHKFMVKGSDHGTPQRSSTIRVSMDVLPIPAYSAKSPVFESIDHQITVAENDAITHVVAFLEAKDVDQHHLWYFIVDGNVDDAFMVQPDNGIVMIAQPLNWVKKSEYNLNISVTDGIHTVYQELPISISDVNDERPMFSKDTYNVDIMENETPGKVILQLEATDDQDTRLFYSIYNSANPQSLKLFQIDSMSGKLSVLQSLDHEMVKKHSLTVMVGDNGTPSKRSFARVVVNVHDINDHAPEFLSTKFEAQVYETAALGTSVVQVMAVDKDKGVNAQMQFRIASGNIGNAFSIQPTLGTVLVAKQLNRQVMPEYFLVIRSIDRGTPSLNSTTTVHITVTVANNAPPKFEQKGYAVEVYENENPGKVVIPVSATSRSSVYYEIIDGNVGDNFEVNPTSGIIRTKKILDFEIINFYNLSIQATNMVGANSTTSVYVHVLDRNDNAPAFAQAEYQGQIIESDPIGSMVLVNGTIPLVIVAYDNDSEINSVLTYSIVEKSALSYFTIDPNTGAVWTASFFDHEKQSSFFFTVQVFDMGKPRLGSDVSAKVFISVMDINDSPPYFDELQYSTMVCLPTFSGVQVIRVHASDPDSVSKVKYSLIAGNSGKKFAVDEDTGDIIIRESDRLDKKYNLVVRATDGEFESSAKINVKVQNTQNIGFQFSEEKYFARVQENATEIRTVAVITLVGSPLREHLSFRILNPNHMFKIGQTSGVLRTTGRIFDRETQSLYTLVVEVQREFLKHANVLVEVAVEDINDNSPFFVNLPYSAVITFDAPLHFTVFKVEAMDLDSGLNSVILYDIIDGDRNAFHIDKKTGVIALIQALNANKYDLIISASDKGNPSLSSLTKLPISVITQDMPVFSKQFYEESVFENLPTGTPVMTVSADSPHGRQLIYSLVSGAKKEDFTLDFNTEPGVGNVPCVLYIIEELDFEVTPKYALTVRATDAISGIFTDVKLSIQVIDVNDNPPMFSQPSYNTTVSEAAPSGTAILQVKATDRDSVASTIIQYSIVGNATMHFHVDNSEGIVYIKRTLDHETQKEHYFVVMATDGGVPILHSTAHVWVTVADINDNPPKFDRNSYECTISQEVQRGQFVTMVLASDPDSSDQSRLNYAIVGGTDLQSFTINKHTGIISLSNLKQFSFENSYVLNVSVTDGVHSSYASVYVNIQGANNHSPHFTHNVYLAALQESVPIGTRVVTVSATDKDLDQYGHVTYAISGKGSQAFLINSETGEIVTNAALDREKHHVYEIMVSAFDFGGRCGFTIVRITITDENDNAPHFAVSEYKATVPVNMTIGTTILKIHASDDDDGPAAVVEYSIYKSNNTLISELFGITHDNGELYLRKSAIGQETYGYQFFIEARDRGTPSQENVVPVNVLFVDPNEDHPRFENFKYVFYLSEKAPIGTIISTLNVTSSGPIAYSFASAPEGSDAEMYLSKFSIDAKGRIILMAEVDREICSTYHLNIEAKTTNIPFRVSSTDVTIVIMDENDNSPIFESSVYSAAVAENIEKGATILKITASDNDLGKSSLLTYSFNQEFDKMSNIFQLDPKSGWLTTLVELDREETAFYNFTINAFDQGIPSRMSSAIINIRVLDYNDNPPEFPLQHYKSQVVEDAVLGTTVVTLSSVDKDEELSNVVYHITNGNPRNQFHILKSGKLFIARPLDREDIPNYQLEVTVTDGKFVSKTWVSVDVSDVNDNPPICLKTKYTEMVSESIAPETYILTVEAADADSYSNSRLYFSLSGEGAGHFALDPITGVLKTKRNIDREVISRYFLVAHVKDEGRPEWECTSSIEVFLSDVNDNAPSFTQEFYSVAVPEDSEIGTLITKVHATDKDIGANRMISYSLIESGHSHFKIDELTGIIHLNKAVDREQVSMYNITIQASDHGIPQLSAVSTLLVIVQDINDNPPEFSAKFYHAVVPEVAPVGMEVLRIIATSKDAGINAEITYNIASSGKPQPFSIHSKSGVLSVAASLDYEKQQNFYLTVQAIDGGSPPLSTEVTINITVTDANDNAPTFSQHTYNAVIREDAVVGDKILQVLAVDADSLPNSKLSYSICGGDRFNEFRIDRILGYISVAAPLDREKVSNYVLEICCDDSGEPSLSSNALVNVEVSDVNDNPPLFSEDNYTAIVQLDKLETHGKREGKPLGFTVLKFTVSDQDAPPNTGPFIFDIISGNEDNAFRLVQQDATLRTANKFDHKNHSEYTLRVRVRDGGKPPLYSDSYVHVLIIEESRFPPVVTPLDVFVSSYRDEFPGGVIGRVHATDADPYDKLLFEIFSTKENLFSIDREDGTLVAAPGLDASIYEVNVSISDGKFTVHTTVTVDVTIISEDALKNGIVLRLSGVTPEDFLLSYKKSLQRGLRNVLNVRMKDVEIISLQPVIRDPNRKQRSASQDLDIVFAVRKGSNAYYFVQSVRKKIKENVSVLEANLGLKVLKVMEDRCSKDYCINGDCVDLIVLNKSFAISITTESSSYVCPQHTRKLQCVCDSGFGGPKCESAINECARRPCPSYRICVPEATVLGYLCKCPDDKTGAACERSKDSVCKRPTCYEEKTPVSFQGRSYISYVLTKPIEEQMNIKLHFRTKQATGNLMFASGARDYSILEISNGILQYRFDCGSGEGVLRVEQVLVNDGAWHEIKVERRGKTAELTLDNRFRFAGKSHGPYELLNLDGTDVYFGAEVRTSFSGHGYEDLTMGYIGCIDDIRVNGFSLPLHYSGNNIDATFNRFSELELHCGVLFDLGVCGSQPCLNGGTCISTDTDFACQCRSRFIGKLCETDTNPCASNPCLNSGICHNVDNSFLCSCSSGITGKRCEYGKYCKPNPCHNKGVCEEGTYGPICKCHGYHGELCQYDVNECQKLRCATGATCVNLQGNFRCQCPPNTTGVLCNEHLHTTPITSSSWNTTLEEIIGIGLAIIIILLLAMVLTCCWRYRHKRQHLRPNNQVLDNTTNEYLLKNTVFEKDHFNRISKISNLEVTSFTTPPLPPRPASYTPSTQDSVNALNNFDTVRSYGSAADDLENFPRQGSDYVQNISKPSLTSVPTLVPPPPSSEDNDSLKKGNWEQKSTKSKDKLYESKVKKDLQLRKNGDVPLLSNIPPPVVPSRGPSSLGVPSILSLNSVDDQSANQNTSSKRSQKEGYIWDCSDWAQSQKPLSNIVEVSSKEVRDSSSLPSTESNSQASQIECLPSKPPNLNVYAQNRLGAAPNQAEIEDYDRQDSEYVGDSETNDNDFDDSTLPGPNFENILGMTDLEFVDDGTDSLPTSPHKYQRHPNSYLPSHALSTANTSPDHSWSMNRHQICDLSDDEVMTYGFPPQGGRGFHIEQDNSGLDAMSMSVGGYTSTNASFSDISGAVCEIDDSEANITDVEQDTISVKPLPLSQDKFCSTHL